MQPIRAWVVVGVLAALALLLLGVYRVSPGTIYSASALVLSSLILALAVGWPRRGT